MARFDILFETDRFNVSEVGKNFINPCCFGQDLAEWLRHQLTIEGLGAGAPYQEDWGWEMLVQRGSQTYYLGMSGYLRGGAVGMNDGEWRIMIEKKRSIWERLRGRNKITETEAIVAIVENILREHLEPQNLRREPVSSSGNTES